ncbi:discoidin domain-containing protein [Paraglaciecola sp.]|uniref:discoidin domain-containing protein n=1 Tax=Paraglaciecola sp. TaxID=1920173 RepID=UPI0030F3D563
MIKYLLPLALLSSLASNAADMRYQSNPKIVTLAADGTVHVKVKVAENLDPIICGQSDYDFEFYLESITSQKWYDALVVANNANGIIDFHYDDASCMLSALSLTRASSTDGSGETPEGELQETGNYGNVALVGTNGLTQSSYSASAIYGQDSPAAAFDGYVYTDKINADADYKISRGIWMAKMKDSAGASAEPWIQVDFGKKVTMAGIRLHINAKSLTLGRSPKSIILMTSDDGNEFVQYDTYTLPYQALVDGKFTTTLKTRFLRLKVQSNYGDANFVEIDEWEIYQK